MITEASKEGTDSAEENRHGVMRKEVQDTSIDPRSINSSPVVR